jgi:hypothetical protein
MGRFLTHIARMGYTLASGVHVVVATKDDKTEYWAVATPRDEALDGAPVFGLSAPAFGR